MKKRWLALLMALAMVVSLFPVAMAADGEEASADQTSAVAQIGEQTYESLQKAVDAAQSGDTITLIGAIDVAAPIVVKDKTLTLDLGGYTISNSQAIWTDTNWSLIEVASGGDLTITGDGKLHGMENDCYAIDLSDGGKCTIESGTFIGNISAVYVYEGTLVVNGGTFSIQQLDKDKDHAFLLNCYDDNYKNGTAQITVNGGSFVGFNPRACAAESGDNSTNFCASGCKVKATTGENELVTYTVTKVEDGQMIVVPEQSGSGEVTVSLEGIFTPTTGTVETTDPNGNNSEGGNTQPSGNVSGTIVTVNLTPNDSGSSVTTAALTVAGGTASSMAENKASLKVESSVGDLTVSTAALDAMSKNAEGGDITLSISKTSTTEESTSITYSLIAQDAAGEEVFDVGRATDAKITVTVKAPTGATTGNPVYVYYIGENGAELEAEPEVGEDGMISWDVTHFSDRVVRTAQSEVSYTSGDSTETQFDTFANALNAVESNGGTITLLQDVELNGNANETDDNYVAYALIEVPANKNVTINSDTGADGQPYTLILNYNAGEADGYSKQAGAIHMNANSKLTLDGVNLIINGSTATNSGNNNQERVGSGFRMNGSSTLTLANSTVTLKNLSRGFNSGAQADNTVIVDSTDLNVIGISGNGSNGGDWEIKNGSTVNFVSIGNHGLSTDALTVDNSTVMVNSAGYTGIYASEMELSNGADVIVSFCEEDTGIPADSEFKGKGVVYLKGDSPTLTVGAGCRLTLSANTKTENGEQVANNTVYVGSGTVTSSGEIWGELKLSESPNQYVVTFASDNVTINTFTVGTTKAEVTMMAAPSKPGYTFGGWKLGNTTYDPNDVVTITQDTTFTAVWTAVGGGTGPAPTPDYSANVTTPANGTVTVSPATAQEGATVTITATPDEGYEVGTVTVTDSSGKAVSVTANANGTYSFVMPEGGATVTATFVAEEQIVFTDVPAGEWYYEPVYWAVENGITDGVTETLFDPEGQCTRAQMVTFLWRAAGQPQPKTTTNPFDDVDADEYYYDAVLWAVEEGITDGVTDTQFDPEGTCTRAQMVTFLWRAAGQPDVSAASGTFEDVDADEYYYQAVQWATQEEITDGMTDTTFQPSGICTRAQAVTFLYRDRI